MHHSERTSKSRSCVQKKKNVENCELPAPAQEEPLKPLGVKEAG